MSCATQPKELREPKSPRDSISVREQCAITSLKRSANWARRTVPRPHVSPGKKVGCRVGSLSAACPPNKAQHPLSHRVPGPPCREVQPLVRRSHFPQACDHASVYFASATARTFTTTAPCDGTFRAK